MLTYMVALSTRSSVRRTTKVNFDNWIGFYMTRNTYTSTTLYRYTSCSAAGMARPPISRVSSKSHASAQKRCRYLYNTMTRYTQKQQPWASVQETGVPVIFFFFSFQIVSCVMMCCCLCLDWMAKLTRREMANILRVSYLCIHIRTYRGLLTLVIIRATKRTAWQIRTLNYVDTTNIIGSCWMKKREKKQRVC